MKKRGLAALLSIAMLGAYVRARFRTSLPSSAVKIKDDLFVIPTTSCPAATVLVTNRASCSWTTSSDRPRAAGAAEEDHEPAGEVRSTRTTTRSQRRERGCRRSAHVSPRSRRREDGRISGQARRTALENGMRLFPQWQAHRGLSLRPRSPTATSWCCPDHRVLSPATCSSATRRRLGYAGVAARTGQHARRALTRIRSVVPGRPGDHEAGVRKFRDSTVAANRVRAIGKKARPDRRCCGPTSLAVSHQRSLDGMMLGFQ
jgi:hypothetical protein